MPEWLHALLVYLVVGVLAGGIAYLGNRLGRKIGRKKMSVLGMRPRHTSNFITALTGVLIAWATLGVGMMVSPAMWTVVVGIDAARKELVRLQAEVEQFRSQALKGQIVWRVGEPILMGTLNPALGEQGLRDQIDAALVAANLESINHNNAIASENGGKPLAPFTQLVQNSDSISVLLQQLLDQTEVTGLKVVAAENCYYQGGVPVKLVLMPVKLVFKEGEVIAQQAVSPGDPHFLAVWYNFLDELKSTAKERGMIEINNSLGGGMTGEDLVRVSEEIAHLNKPGMLRAVARRDLYQTSQLDVKVEVVARRGTP